MAHKIMNGKTEEERKLSNKNFIKTLNRVLQYKKSFEFPFDSLVTIARVKSPDNTFRIFNWILRKKIIAMNTMALYITSIKIQAI